MADIASATVERQAAPHEGQAENRTPGREAVSYKRPLDLFAQINRNLMSFPLARSSTVPESWSKSKTGCWFCDLPR